MSKIFKKLGALFPKSKLLTPFEKDINNPIHSKPNKGTSSTNSRDLALDLYTNMTRGLFDFGRVANKAITEEGKILKKSIDARVNEAGYTSQVNTIKKNAMVYSKDVKDVTKGLWSLKADAKKMINVQHVRNQTSIYKYRLKTKVNERIKSVKYDVKSKTELYKRRGNDAFKNASDVAYGAKYIVMTIPKTLAENANKITNNAANKIEDTSTKVIGNIKRNASETLNEFYDNKIRSAAKYFVGWSVVVAGVYGLAKGLPGGLALYFREDGENGSSGSSGDGKKGGSLWSAGNERR